MTGQLAVFLQETRHALRALRRRMGVSALIALTVGAAAGPLTVALGLAKPETLVDHGVDAPETLVQITGSLPRASGGGEYGRLSYPEFAALERYQVTLAPIAASARASADLRVGAETQRVEVGLVSDGYFGLLGVRMRAGSPWPPAGAEGSGEPVAVMSEALWESAMFGASPSTVGSVVTINDLRVRIVAIAGDRFAGLEPRRPEAVWMPLSLQPHFADEAPPLDAWDAHAFSVVGRAKSPAALDQTNDDVRRLSASLEAEQPIEWRGRRFRAEPLERRAPAGDSAASALNSAMWLLAAILLALACFNVSGILLVRALSTEHATAVQMALGLSFRRLLGGAFLQATFLTLLGGAVSWLFASWLLGTIRYRTGGGVTGTLGWEAAVGVGVAAVIFAACLIIVPALFWRRMIVSEVLATGGRTERASARRAGNGLVALQVAMSLVVAAASLMLGRSLEKFRQADAGFPTADLLSVSIDFRRRTDHLDAASLDALKLRLAREIRELPGVNGAGLGMMPLLLHGAAVTNDVSAPGGTIRRVAIDVVGPGYFAALGVPMVAGDPLGESHDRAGVPSVVVNRSLATAFWPNGSAIDQELEFPRRNGEQRVVRVIGVVADFRGDFVGREVEPRVFKAALQEPFVIGHLYVRSDGSAQTLREVKRAVTALLPQSPTPVVIKSVDELREESLSFLKNAFLVANALAAISLVLAIAGIFSLQSFVVARRRREFGIRLALGAGPLHLVALVLADAVKAIAGGILVATPLVILSASFLKSIVPGVESLDSFVALGALGALGAVVLGGSAWPTLQVLKVDPLTSVRES